MEYCGTTDQVLSYLFRLQIYVRTWISVKREITVPVWKLMYQRKRGMHSLVINKTFCIYAGFLNSFCQLPAKTITPYLAYKSCFAT